VSCFMQYPVMVPRRGMFNRRLFLAADDRTFAKSSWLIN
jgi:hypothetical protein